MHHPGTLGVRFIPPITGITGQTTVPLGPEASTVAIPAGGRVRLFSKPTWRIALAHQFSRTGAYVSYNRGFKSGVFDFGSRIRMPREAESGCIQIGVHVRISCNRRLRVNAAIFA